jgi:hypothetical protein
MARTNVTVRQTDASGVLDVVAVQTALHASDGAMFTNDGRTRCWIKNTGAGSHTVSFVVTKTEGQYGLALGNKSYVIANGKEALVGPFDPSFFNQKSGADAGKVYVNTGGTQSEVVIVPFKD